MSGAAAFAMWVLPGAGGVGRVARGATADELRSAALDEVLGLTFGDIERAVGVLR